MLNQKLTTMTIEQWPTELVGWITIHPNRENWSARQITTYAILENADVIKHATPFLDAVNNAENGEDANQRISDLYDFIDVAAALSERIPKGSNLDDPSKFYTSAELKRNITKAADTALKLIDEIKSIAPTIDPEFLTNDSRALIEQLEKLHAACIATVAKSLPVTNDTPDYPLGGGTAGANSYRNWIIKELGILSDVHLGTVQNNLIAAIAAVITETKRPNDVSYLFENNANLVSREDAQVELDRLNRKRSAWEAMLRL